MPGDPVTFTVGGRLVRAPVSAFGPSPLQKGDLVGVHGRIGADRTWAGSSPLGKVAVGTEVRVTYWTEGSLNGVIKLATSGGERAEEHFDRTAVLQ